MHEFVLSIQHDIYSRVSVLCISFKYQFPICIHWYNLFIVFQVWTMDKIVLVDEIEKMVLKLIPDLIVNEFKSRIVRD